MDLEAVTRRRGRLAGPWRTHLKPQSLLNAEGRYSSGVQQPRHAMATLSSRPHTRQAAPLDREQEQTVGVHPDGLPTLAAFWPHKDAQRCCLLRTSEYRLGRSPVEWADSGYA